MNFYNGEDGLHYRGAYPDFYNDKLGLVIDAKYKPLENRLRSADLRENRFQLISYMHNILRSKAGLLMYPTTTENPQPQWEGTLCGYGGKVGIYGFKIPNNSANFTDFTRDMDSVTNQVIENITKLMI